jgi:hypothetical protein
VVKVNSVGKTSETKMKYVFDFTLPSVDISLDCSGTVQKSNFMTFFDFVYNSTYLPVPPGESPPIAVGSSFKTEFTNCGLLPGGFPKPCYLNLMSAFMRYLSSPTAGRLSYINCQLSNKNSFRANFDAAKANADVELKPILWGRDIYFNSVVESSEWKNGNLVNATYNIFSNNRNDQFGLYPSKMLKLFPQNLATTFTPSVVSTSNTSIDKDTRYREEAIVDYSKGTLLNLVAADGVPVSYQWGNGFLPIAQATNAANKAVEMIDNVGYTPQFQLSTTNTAGQGSPLVFTQRKTGSFSIILPQLPSWAQVTLSYNLSGPQSQTGTLCKTGSSGASCSTTPSTMTISNLPAGNYTLTYAVSTNSSTTFNYSFSVNYQGIVIGSIKEFFFEGFEENAQSVAGNAHTGGKFWNSNYTPVFARPNTRSYIIQWWNFASGKWNFNQQSYADNMVLTGPVDDVRIFPSDAQVTTFTYEPGIGMTSQLDAKGLATYFFYDALGRLFSTRDNNYKLIKQYEYNYKHE